MEEENTDGKRKTIPANYISIRHLQERWINEKDWKRKEEEEKRRKQQVEEQPRIEDDLKKTEKARGQGDEEKRLDRSNRKNWGRDSRKKEPMNGGDVKVVEEKEPEVTAAIGSERDEDAAAAPEKNLRGFRRKRYTSKKKKNQDVAVVEDVVVDSGCESIAPPPEVVVTEKITPVKDVIEVYRKKGEKATGKKSIEYCEKTVTAAIGSERGEDAAAAPEKKLRGFRRKLYKSKKKKNQDAAVVEDVVVDSGCESIAPPPEVVVTEKITPVKNVIGVYRKKGEKATGKKSVEYCEKTVTEVTTTAIETQFENLSIKKLETKNLKAQTRSSNRNRLNQGNDLVLQRGRMPIRAASASTMVWVKKEQNEKAGDGFASGVKPFNA